MTMIQSYVKAPMTLAVHQSLRGSTNDGTVMSLDSAVVEAFCMTLLLCFMNVNLQDVLQFGYWILYLEQLYCFHWQWNKNTVITVKGCAKDNNITVHIFILIDIFTRKPKCSLSFHCMTLISRSLFNSFRVLVWCLCISLWSATQKRRHIGLTRLSTVPDFLSAASTAASTSIQRPGLHRRAHGTDQRSPATSPSSLLRTPNTSRRPNITCLLRESRQLPALPLELIISFHHQLLVLHSPITILFTLERMEELQHHRPCPCPHHPLQCHPHTITHICAWVPLPAKCRLKRKFFDSLF